MESSQSIVFTCEIVHFDDNGGELKIGLMLKNSEHGVFSLSPEMSGYY